jgi:PIN domain nuclease of toxin-antitoxin system
LSIAVSAISLAEIVYLVEKKRLPASVYIDLKAVLGDTNSVLEEVPFSGETAEAMRMVPRDAVPDMPDRMIAATAIHLGVPVISRDGRISASSVETVW